MRKEEAEDWWREEEAVPLTPKGKKIKRAMQREYGRNKGERVFYAAQNSGRIKGTHKTSKRGR